MTTGTAIPTRLTAVRQSKYRNVRTTVDGLVFASKAEARRYQELRLLERAGEITDLAMQVRYPLMVHGVKVTTYVADFTYTDKHGALVDEDVKGVSTPLFKLKRKLFEAIYVRDIIIIGQGR